MVDVVTSGVENPRSIAVFPPGGLIFWSDLGDVARIERADLDGENRLAIVSDYIVWPQALCVDTTPRTSHTITPSSRTSSPHRPPTRPTHKS